MFKTLQGYCLQVEDEKFFDDMKTIDKYEAFKMLAKSRIEDEVGRRSFQSVRKS